MSLIRPIENINSDGGRQRRRGRSDHMGPEYGKVLSDMFDDEPEDPYQEGLGLISPVHIVDINQISPPS